MKRQIKSIKLFIMVTVVFLVSPVFSYYLVAEASGKWPLDWPKELEPLREKSQTIAISIEYQQQNIHDIPFDDRQTFERIWPIILELKSKGAPLTLYRVGSKQYEWSLLSKTKPVVRILAPSGAYINLSGEEAAKASRKKQESIKPGVPPAPPKPISPEGRLPDTGEIKSFQQAKELVKQGKMLYAGPPWPRDILTPEGKLPEFVQSKKEGGKLKWIPADRFVKVKHRSRIDIELFVDGQVIDLNRILLPPDTPIIDKRWNNASEADAGEK